MIIYINILTGGKYSRRGLKAYRLTGGKEIPASVKACDLAHYPYIGIIRK